MKKKQLIATMVAVSLLAAGCGVSTPDQATKGSKQEQPKVTDEPFVEITPNPSESASPAKLERLKEINKNLKIAKDPKSWKKVDGKYQYPISPYGEYTNHDRDYMDEFISMYDLPLSLQQELSTTELYEFVLRNPFTERMMGTKDNFYDNGMQYAADHIQGMKELLGRDDLYEAVLDYFDKYEIPNEIPEFSLDSTEGEVTEEDSKAIYEYTIALSTIYCSESILVTYAEKVDDQLRERAKKVLAEKIKQADASEYHDEFSTVGFIMRYDDSLPKDMVDAVQTPYKDNGK